MYPNDLILENTVLKNNKLNPIHDFITYDECSVCWKKVTGNETLACSYCNHWVHKQCIGYFKNRAEYQNFLHYYSTKHWDCPTCMSDILPFTLLEQEEFLMLLLDMNVQPVYLNKDNFQRIYTDLHSIDFFKTIDADEITHNRYLNEIDPDINHPTIDTCNYIIDTNNLSIKSSKELVMMTFNIRSIKKNFDNFTKLLSSITVKVHIICLTESWLGTLDNIDDRVKRIMDSVKQKLENPNKLTLKQFNRQLKATTPSLTASFPFHPTITKKIKKSLASHDVKVTSSSGTTLRDLLTKTKTTPPPHLTPNVIYEISCNDCTATYNGQTNRPLIKRIKEHESHSRLHLHNPDDFSHNQSAPAHHSRTTGHKIAWDRTTILTTTRYKTQLDLTEHTAIKTRNPSLNRTDSAPTCSKLWDPIIPKIACTIKPRPAGISFPKKK